MSILTALRNAQSAVGAAIDSVEEQIEALFNHDAYSFRSLAAIQKAVPGVTRDDILAVPGVRTARNNPDLFTMD